MSSIEQKNPQILVFAGPNGSGKSTITKKVQPIGLYINADDIKAMNGCSDLAAAQEAEAIREHLLKKKFQYVLFLKIIKTSYLVSLLAV